MQHCHSIQVIFATTLSLFTLVAGCGRSDSTISSQEGSESPVAVEVKADAAPAQAAPASETEVSESTEAEKAEQFFALLTAALETDEQAIYETVGDEKTLTLAQSTCQEFKTGKSFDEIAQDVVKGLESAGLTGEQLDKVAYYSGKVMGAGVTVFCPEYQDEIQQNEQSEPSEPSESPESTASAQPSGEATEKFFSVLDSVLSDEEKSLRQTIGNEETLNLAQAACQDFKQGKSFEIITNDVVGGLQEAGLQGDALEKAAYYSGKAIGVGVAVFCPEYRSQIEGSA